MLQQTWASRICTSWRLLLNSINSIFFMQPTFITVVGTDGEYSKSNIRVLVHVNLIRCLCERRLVIVYVTDKNADICGVWNNTNTEDKEWNTHTEKEDIMNINIFPCLYDNLITFPKLVHAQRNTKNTFPPLLSLVHLHSLSLCYCESRLVLFLLQ